jgi:hypothetical protein
MTEATASKIVLAGGKAVGVEFDTPVPPYYVYDIF